MNYREKIMRGTVILITIMTILIFLALGALLYGFTKKPSTSSNAIKDLDIKIEHEVKNISLSDNKIIINDGNKKLYIIDLPSKKLSLTVNIVK